ncbi:hypothetical protein IPA_09530 [Ignicoccus pacificus DSM 13166]|uniref:Transcription regulator TrmB N-terminal domain-containing protein n=1 Tax=Ignicoccus pacificus DSM 13166 TaxID=940294 RepID=A0A977PLE5_9CREN|nr:hypothetical protein IPA_09530 [Ignicoccus pacificus DSM 13166]
MIEYDIDSLSLAVLFAIKNGLKDPKAIARELNVDEDSIREVIEELEDRGLIKVEKKKFLFFETSDVKLTREGYNTLLAALDKLKPKLEEARKIAVERGPDEAMAFLGAMGLGLLAPLLLPLLLGGIFTLPFMDPSGGHNNNIHPGEPF